MCALLLLLAAGPTIVQKGAVDRIAKPGAEVPLECADVGSPRRPGGKRSSRGHFPSHGAYLVFSRVSGMHTLCHTQNTFHGLLPHVTPYRCHDRMILLRTLLPPPLVVMVAVLLLMPGRVAWFLGLGDFLAGTIAVLIGWARMRRQSPLLACQAACAIVRRACHAAYQQKHRVSSGQA